MRSQATTPRPMTRSLTTTPSKRKRKRKPTARKRRKRKRPTHPIPLLMKGDGRARDVVMEATVGLDTVAGDMVAEVTAAVAFREGEWATSEMAAARPVLLVVAPWAVARPQQAAGVVGQDEEACRPLQGRVVPGCLLR